MRDSGCRDAMILQVDEPNALEAFEYFGGGGLSCRFRTMQEAGEVDKLRVYQLLHRHLKMRIS